MANNLVIVESPAKAKTIKKFLGSNYEVIASNGHVRDLPKSTLGIDVEHGFEPHYITIRGKGDILAKLRKEVKKAGKVYLATDPDREGEAISWHLSQALKLDDKAIHRITFNEITKDAIKNSVRKSRKIDMDMVNSQQARRMIDRMVGYEISPLLWDKVKRGLSAGRVQSVALRMICDREDEINNFVPEEYWSLQASFGLIQGKKPFEAKFYGTPKEKMELKDENTVRKIMEEIKKQSFSIKEIKKSKRTKKQPLPFTTSTLQQEASKQLNFSPQKTMRIAQQLYEGIDVKGYGMVGLITYLRTDSTRISEEADRSCREYIEKNFGNRYVLKESDRKEKKGRIQDAHEAIRPTNVEMTPVVVKESLPRDLFRLYQLIWKRFVASRMANAEYEVTSLKIDSESYRFTAAASENVFDGFLSVYSAVDEKEENAKFDKSVKEGTELSLVDIESSRHFTQSAPHYTEASLIKALEEQGIGRPSTYAPTITTILARRYVIKEDKNLYVTELGEVVNHIMVDAFPSIVEQEFTANMEGLLDSVEDGTVSWKTVVSNFYPDLTRAVKEAGENLEKYNIADEVSDELCEFCGRNMVVKYGPHGKFLACPGFPECRSTKPYLEKIGIPCPKCGKDIVIRKTKKGRRYFGCEGIPECDFMTWQKPSGKLCPECNSMLLEKGSQLVCSGENCGYHEKKVDSKEENGDFIKK